MFRDLKVGDVLYRLSLYDLSIVVYKIKAIDTNGNLICYHLESFNNNVKCCLRIHISLINCNRYCNFSTSFEEIKLVKSKLIYKYNIACIKRKHSDN